MIVEVVSPATEDYDRGRKFEHYRSIPSLSRYLLVASARINVELYTRQDSGQWLLTAAAQPPDAIELTSVGCRLTVEDVYRNVVLTPED